jgi:tRNA A37 threonylcarbamoyladenosine biosynthesis protein TsaE
MLLDDQPVDKKDSDRLNYLKEVQAIAALLNKANPPFVLGLQGDWGSSKTTMLRLL